MCFFSFKISPFFYFWLLDNTCQMIFVSCWNGTVQLPTTSARLWEDIVGDKTELQLLNGCFHAIDSTRFLISDVTFLALYSHSENPLQLIDLSRHREKRNQLTMTTFMRCSVFFLLRWLLSKQVVWKLFSQLGCKTKTCLHLDKTVSAGAAASLVEGAWLLHISRSRNQKVCFIFVRGSRRSQHCSCDRLFYYPIFLIGPLSAALAGLWIFLLKGRFTADAICSDSQRVGDILNWQKTKWSNIGGNSCWSGKLVGRRVSDHPHADWSRC